jgi:uncharacterized protein (TIGR00251 family)
MESARLDIRLKPRAKGDRIRPGPDGLLDIAVTSPPVDDRANSHLVRLLAERLGVAATSIAVVRGAHCRRKTVYVEGMTKEQVFRKINEWL